MVVELQIPQTGGNFVATLSLFRKTLLFGVCQKQNKGTQSIEGKVKATRQKQAWKHNINTSKTDTQNKENCVVSGMSRYE